MKFLTTKNFIDEKNPISATLCVIVENSNYKLGEQNEKQQIFFLIY